MKILKILIVDDELEDQEDFLDLLNDTSVADLVGDGYSGFKITTAKDQREADQALLAEGFFDLILLDLRYPVSQEEPLKDDYENEGDDDTANRLQGIIWLPALRRYQPEATIVIRTSYADDAQMLTAVNAISKCQANDFIPKTEGFANLVRRINVAHANARRVSQLRLMETELRGLVRTQALRAYAEDVGRLLSDSCTSLYNIANRIESGNKMEIDIAPATIRAELNNFKKQFGKLAMQVNGGGGKSRKVDINLLIRQMLSLSRLRIEETEAKWIIEPAEHIPVMVSTYPGDLKVALLELITNAADALEKLPTQSGNPLLSINIEKQAEIVTVRVADNGVGFSEEALANKFKPGFTTKNLEARSSGDQSENEPQHQGMGLYIAKRMMHHIGGRIEIGNRREGGAVVTLTLRDLPTS